MIGALGLAFFVLYVATATRWYTFDTVSYATDIRRFERTGDPGWLVHPHHLIFNLMGWLTYRLLARFDEGALTIAGVQTFTAFMGAAGVAAFALWLHEETRSRWASLTGAAALGGTFGWWFASADGRANLAATAVLLLVLWALRRAAREAPLRWCAAAGALLGLTCLLHESHVLFAPVALLAAALLPGAWPQRLARAGVLGACFALTLGIPYGAVLVWVKGFRSVGETTAWLATYSRQGTWWNFDIPANLVKDGKALYKLFVGQQVRVLPGGDVTLGNAWALAAVALWASLGGVALAGASRGAWRRHRRFLAPPLLGLAAYSAFFTVWDPGYFVFWFAQGAFLIALLTLGWHRAARRGVTRAVVTSCVALLIYVTYAGAMAAKTDASGNPHLLLAQRVGRIADPRGLVVLSGMGGAAEAEVYVPYFARMQVFALQKELGRAGGSYPRAAASLRALIDKVLARGNRVYLLSEATEDPGTLQAMEERYGIVQSELRALFAPYERAAVDRGGYVVIYELKARPPAPVLPPLPFPLLPQPWEATEAGA